MCVGLLNERASQALARRAQFVLELDSNSSKFIRLDSTRERTSFEDIFSKLT